MIDIRKLKELVRLMVTNDLTEVDLRDSEEQVTLKRANQQAPVSVPTSMPAQYFGVPLQSAASAPAGGAAAATPASAGDADSAGLVEIASPMVGTFYAAPSPDKPPFIAIGGSVGPESVVCLIEAMKVFNEIKAECSGSIERVLVKTGEPVEFGQRLFLVRPS